MSWRTLTREALLEIDSSQPQRRRFGLSRTTLFIWVLAAVGALIVSLLAIKIWPNQSVSFGTLFLALLTFVIVLINARVLAAMSEQSSVASRTLQEIQRDRELAASPFPVIGLLGTRTVNGLWVQDVSIKNIGRGPALNCFYAREESTPQGPRFLMVDPVNLGRGDSTTVPAEQQVAGTDYQDLFAIQKPPRDAIVCEDQFGNMFRFIPGRPEPVVWRAEGIEELEEEKPDWAIAMTRILRP